VSGCVLSGCVVLVRVKLIYYQNPSAQNHTFFKSLR